MKIYIILSSGFDLQNPFIYNIYYFQMNLMYPLSDIMNKN